MKYSRFFYLHIPKTGGTHFTEHMIADAEKIFVENDIKINNQHFLELDTGATKHWCWFKPFIQDDTYIYTMLRDPAKRLVSQFAWQAKAAILYTNTPYTFEDINKNNFYKWLDKNDNLYKDVQAKNLVYYDEDHTPYQISTDLSWNYNDVPRKKHFMFTEKFNDFKINIEELNKNINRINFIVKSEDLFISENQIKIINKIFNDLGLEKYKPNMDINNTIYINSLSEKLFNEFSKKEIEWLYEYQKIDSEIYFSNIFTKY